MKIYDSIDALIGKTPLLEAHNFAASVGTEAHLFLQVRVL